jgi:hypothetical protein
LMTNCATVLLTAETMMVSLPVESEGMLVEETVDLMNSVVVKNSVLLLLEH